MRPFRVKGVGYKTGIGMLVLAVFLLGGCDLFDTLGKLFRFENHAQAQQDFVIQTFIISPGTFRILTDTLPTIVVHDVSTEYTDFVDGTSLRFTPAGGSEQTLSMDPEDRIIERPGVNALTVIRAP